MILLKMSKKFIGDTWELGIPIGPKGQPMKISPKDLDTYDSAFFHTLEDRVVLSAPCAGTTTPGSKYPRSELREVFGDKLAFWDSKKGEHTMTYTAAVLHLPAKKPQVVVGQVHASSDDLFEIRLTGSHLEVFHDDKVYGTLITCYKLGDFFDISITVKNGEAEVKTPTKTIKFKVWKNSKSNYFKLGAYVQSNASKGDGEDYGAVAIKKCLISHK